METTPTFADEERRWRAVVERDPAAEGAFCYAVTTTGVVCRPGCPSRLPKREHVRFFDTYQEAADAGFRPCRRCRPDATPPGQEVKEAIVRACRRIQEAEQPPRLQELAEEAGMSPWHFHRLFKQVVGLTPKQYAAAQQAERFRAGLRASRSVTDAIYEAGYGSSSRAYEAARDRLGMPPSIYRKGGAGLTIRYGVGQCSLGWVVVGATERGICFIGFGDSPEDLPALVQERFPKARLEPAGPDFAALLQKVLALAEAPGQAADLPLDIRGTAFQEQVWRALRQIPPGTTATYAQVAEQVGRPRAARAVARACATNPLAVAVPCHRVVRSDGGLGGYRWGVERKRALLQREGATWQGPRDEDGAAVDGADGENCTGR